MRDNLVGALLAILGGLCLLGLRHLILSIGKSKKPRRVKDENHESVRWAEFGANAAPLVRETRSQVSSERA
ncbi:MAG TPA: hypothetical protein VFV34_14710 [Blastocatellia bacterium]|nr:hypothetical protein [Blastocatellia bacterium]